jgi:hypothetical protein
MPRFVIQKHAARSLHALEYGDFEGVIGKGYGAGAVIVWDTRPYRNLGDLPIEDALEQGHDTFWLEGQKLKGAWSLRRIAEGKDERWLLVKKRDEEADARRNPVSTQPESIVSGRTIEQVREQEG